MTEPKKPIAVKLDDLPDHLLENINRVCKEILRTALLDMDNEMLRAPEIAIGAMQKAIALCLIKLYGHQDVVAIAQEMCSYIIHNVRLWSEQKVWENLDDKS